MERIGKILYLENDGFGGLITEGKEGVIYPFTFVSLRHYRGEHVGELKALGIRKDAIIWFSLSKDFGGRERIATDSIHPLVFVH